MKITFEDFNIGEDHIERFDVGIHKVARLEDINWPALVESVKYDYENFKKEGRG